MQYELEAVIIGFRFIANCRQDKSNNSLMDKNILPMKKHLFHSLSNPAKKERVSN